VKYVCVNVIYSLELCKSTLSYVIQIIRSCEKDSGYDSGFVKKGGGVGSGEKNSGGVGQMEKMFCMNGGTAPTFESKIPIRE